MEREEFYQFKRDLVSYKAYCSKIADLRNQINIIDHNMQGVRSPKLGGTHALPRMNRDQMYNDAIVQKDKIEALLNAYVIVVNEIDRKMEKLTAEERDILRLVYMEHVSIVKMARTYYCSEASMYRTINRIVRKAIQ